MQLNDSREFVGKVVGVKPSGKIELGVKKICFKA